MKQDKRGNRWVRTTVFQGLYGTQGTEKWEPMRDQLSLAECHALLTSEIQDTAKHGALAGEYAILLLPVNTVRFLFKEGELSGKLSRLVHFQCLPGAADPRSTKSE